MGNVDVREIRRKLRMNQRQFWAKLGVTQSGGSRYENGRNMPRTVRQLLRLVYVEMIDIGSVTREDCEIVEYLKSHDEALYRFFKKQARSKIKETV